MKQRQTTILLFIFLMILVGGVRVSAQDVAQQFRDPAKTYRPMVRWWWPGDDVQDAELRREIDLLDKDNFGGAEIQPFNKGLSPEMTPAVRARVNDYLTPTFFGHIQAAVEEARAHGMWIDYTFGSGWPFGGAGVVTPKLASVELRSTHQSVQGPVHFHAILAMPVSRAQLPSSVPRSWEEEFKEREKLVAVVAIRTDDPKSSVILTQRMKPDGTLDWEVPPGAWQVYSFMELPTGQQVNAGIGAGTQLVLDHMSRHAFDVYAQRVGGRLRQYDGQYFDKGLRAIFCDSLEVRANLYWSDDFLEQFQQRRGYDLTPYLPLLEEGASARDSSGTPIGAELADRVRRDYRQTVSDVMIDSFYSPFVHWAATNNLLSRIQAHGSPTDWLRVYGAASIPETEDLYDNGRYDFLKMASSAADLDGRKIVSSESFVWAGEAYQSTPEKLKRYADELFTAGINEVIYHGYPYQYMDRPLPGWHPFALVAGRYSSDINQNNPFWPYLGQLNEYMTRVQYLSQIGKTVTPVLIYRGPLPYDFSEPSQAEVKLDTDLFEAGYNFDHIDDYVLLHSRVVNGKLVSPGGSTYSVLILQDQTYISAELSKQLANFSQQGFPIIFLGAKPQPLPVPVNNRLVANASDAPLQRLFAAKDVHYSTDIGSAIQTLKASASPNLRFQGPGLYFIEKRIGKLNIFFLRNPDNAGKQTALSVEANGTPEIWNPWTGAIRPLAEFHRDGKTVHIPLYVEAYGSVILVFDPQGNSSGKPVDLSSQPQPAIQLAVGAQGWNFHGVGIGPGSKPVTIDIKMPTLVDWSMSDRLRSFSGSGVYTTTFNVPAALLQSRHPIVLNLGDVKDVAQISINGRPGPTLLLRPYRADVGPLLHAGENTLKVTVVNALFNALAANGPSLNYRPESTGTPNGLMPSGLLGPVRLEEMSH